MGCTNDSKVETDGPLIPVFHEHPDLSDLQKDNMLESNNCNNKDNTNKDNIIKGSINGKNELCVDELVKEMTFKKVKESKTIFVSKGNEDEDPPQS